jgi:hypothetical protein
MSSQVLAPQLFDHGTVGAGTSTIEIWRGLYQRLTLSAATRTIADPIVGTKPEPTGPVAVPVTGPAGPTIGTILFIEVKNASGGASTVTYGSAFKGAPANPANGQRKVHAFIWDGVNWVLTSAAPDVPN